MSHKIMTDRQGLPANRRFARASRTPEASPASTTRWRCRGTSHATVWALKGWVADEFQADRRLLEQILVLQPRHYYATSVADPRKE
jgi:hypothetical protein